MEARKIIKNLVIALWIGLISSASFASGFTEISGINHLGESFKINAQEDELRSLPQNAIPETHYMWCEISVNAHGKKKTYKKQPCTFSTAGISFSFEVGGQTSLAGSTYINANKWLSNCKGELYVCKSGCRKQVPRKMINAPDECHDLD
jgi:hypothetical protein